jgi:ubiquinone/menaquinone biosynthesis C-methylase UbiE
VVDNRQLQRSYTFLAPFYDRFVGPATRESRRRSIEGLALGDGERLLVPGIGTGLDVGFVPRGTVAVGLDLTLSMLLKARPLARDRRLSLVVGDASRLPFRHGAFDAALLHLILAVVPDARPALAEAVRAVKPGGRLAVFDKFLKPGEAPSAFRRLADRLVRPFATGLNTRFEELLEGTPGVAVEEDAPDRFGGLFRRIRLRKPGR